MLDNIGFFSFRKDGELHAWNPDTISLLQLATHAGSYKKDSNIPYSGNR